ncbi:MAG TPA: hypothetical protein VFF32_04840, partial [Dermatophilaceae bacterium]|nr:hypothetical protein [Dermatophilaceae bacterium]
MDGDSRRLGRPGAGWAVATFKEAAPARPSRCIRGHGVDAVALKKSDLYSSLWKSCDELRGGMDA